MRGEGRKKGGRQRGKEYGQAGGKNFIKSKLDAKKQP